MCTSIIRFLNQLLCIKKKNNDLNNMNINNYQLNKFLTQSNKKKKWFK